MACNCKKKKISTARPTKVIKSPRVSSQDKIPMKRVIRRATR